MLRPKHNENPVTKALKSRFWIGDIPVTMVEKPYRTPAKHAEKNTVITNWKLVLTNKRRRCRRWSKYRTVTDGAEDRDCVPVSSCSRGAAALGTLKLETVELVVDDHKEDATLENDRVVLLRGIYIRSGG